MEVQLVKENFYFFGMVDLIFDIGWVGCITSDEIVNTGAQINVGVEVADNKCFLLINNKRSKRQHRQLPLIKDHPDTSVHSEIAVGHWKQRGEKP
eukprot:UN11672